MEFSLSWESEQAKHTDRYFAPKIDFWRDIFPARMKQDMLALREGETCRERFAEGVLVPPHEEVKVFEFDERGFCHRTPDGRGIIPERGRFYPSGFACCPLGCFKGNIVPFRLIGIGDGTMSADTNHPLARYPLTLEAKCVEKLGAIEQHGGLCNHIPEMVTGDGPGMQVPYPGVATDFYAGYPFRRGNEEDDAVFYRAARMVNHLDDTAIHQVESIYAGNLSPEMKILDLMSSRTSHLPASLRDCSVTGLGLNEEELQANGQLSETVLHDLNAAPTPTLPFEKDEFDAVICSASIEYLIRPLEVMADVGRVLRPGGVFITTFSDRWFPGKEILPWKDMHHFERFGFVLDLYVKTGLFRDLRTESIRNLPRPWNDPHIRETFTSDPIFAVWGKRLSP